MRDNTDLLLWQKNGSSQFLGFSLTTRLQEKDGYRKHDGQ